MAWFTRTFPTTSSVDFEVSDDLTVGDDATVTGDLSVTGNLAVTGTLDVTDAATFVAAVTFEGVGTFEDAPVLEVGALLTAQTVTPAAAEAAGNTILPGVTAAAVAANTTNTNDFIVLPALASVPVGHTITVVCNAAGHEIRTPATSAEEINSEDCDGTKEYTVAAGGQIHVFRKIDDTIGWMGQGFTAIGAVVTAIVPDA